MQLISNASSIFAFSDDIVLPTITPTTEGTYTFDGILKKKIFEKTASSTCSNVQYCNFDVIAGSDYGGSGIAVMDYCQYFIVQSKIDIEKIHKIILDIILLLMFIHIMTKQSWYLQIKIQHMIQYV